MVSVASNFYELSVDKTEAMPSIPNPNAEGPAMIAGPPTPVGGTLEWLDVDGKVVGPAKRKIPGFQQP